jgi:ribosomal protein S25
LSVSAPAIADRILRDLRQRGVVEYRVLSRRESLYEVMTARAA